MLTHDKAQHRAAQAYRQGANCNLAELQELTARQTDQADYPLASAVEKNVLIYDCMALGAMLTHPADR